MDIVTQINVTKLERLSEQGQNSEVWKVYDPQLKAEMAMKEIHIPAGEDPQLYLTEAQKLHLTHHAHVVQVRWAAVEGSTMRLVMPLYRAGSLQARMERQPLTVREVLRYTEDLLAGLNHVHQHGLVHADIKPNNILMHDSGYAMLSDFGQSAFADLLGVASVERVYNLHSPPEHWQTRTLTRQSDIYQVGLTLYRLLNGPRIWLEEVDRLMVDPKVDHIIQGTWPDRSLFLPHVPQALRNIVRKAIKPDQADRYQTVNELHDALAGLTVPEQMLDWRATSSASAWSWERSTSSHNLSVQLCPQPNGSMAIDCQKVNRQSSAIQHLRAHEEAGITDRAAAFRKLATVLREVR